MQHLLLIHVGPVQDFIASARRSRDLWFGSWLLSELSKAAAQAIVEQNSLESLIFPAPRQAVDLAAGSDFNVANKVVAIVDQPPEEIGESIRWRILERLGQIRDEAYQHVHGSFDQDVAEQQVEDMLEYFWVGLPLEAEPTYPGARTALEALMAARKVTRQFDQVTWGSHKPKSSLDGLRESVIPESAYPTPKESDEVRRSKIERLYRDYGAGPAERLSGVDLLKRHGRRGQADSFFSTSHVAALPLLERLPDTAKGHVDQYIQELKALKVSDEALTSVPGSPHPAFDRYDGHLLFEADAASRWYPPGEAFDRYDGHLLFEERLREFFEDESAFKQAKQSLGDFLQRAVGGERPIPYYGLLLADGDGMGKAIDHQKTVANHRRLSQSLAGFAREGRQIVSKHQGSLVYAGGDDVLAFVPLHTALTCARELAGAFAQTMQGFRYGEGQSPTLSVGVAVSHHLEPLSDALALARATERTAKQVPGKNALAVTISKRSGVDRTVAGPWGTLDQRLDWFIDLHRRDAIPDGAAYELCDLARRLVVPVGQPNYDNLQKGMRVEAIRLLARKRAERGSRGVQQEILERLKDHIENQSVLVGQLADELIVARTFADAVPLANLPLSEGGT